MKLNLYNYFKSNRKEIILQISQFYQQQKNPLSSSMMINVNLDGFLAPVIDTSDYRLPQVNLYYANQSTLPVPSPPSPYMSGKNGIRGRVLYVRDINNWIRAEWLVWVEVCLVAAFDSTLNASRAATGAPATAKEHFPFSTFFLRLRFLWSPNGNSSLTGYSNFLIAELDVVRRNISNWILVPLATETTMFPWNVVPSWKIRFSSVGSYSRQGWNYVNFFDDDGSSFQFNAIQYDFIYRIEKWYSGKLTRRSESSSSVVVEWKSKRQWATIRYCRVRNGAVRRVRRNDARRRKHRGR